MEFGSGGREGAEVQRELNSIWDKQAEGLFCIQLVPPSFAVELLFRQVPFL